MLIHKFCKLKFLFNKLLNVFLSQIHLCLIYSKIIVIIYKIRHLYVIDVKQQYTECCVNITL